jgi:putative ABC transport system permease protein
VTLAIPVAWLQLEQERARTLVAIAGVMVAVVLIFMQLGFRDALFDSAVRLHSAFRYDLAMVNPKTDYLVRPESFSRRRLYQALGFPGVEAVSPVYLSLALWRDPQRRQESAAIFVVGFDPTDPVLELAGVRANLDRLRLPDVALFDAHSRPEFGPIPELVRARGSVATEVGNRNVSVVGLYELGTSFGIDGSLVTSDLNFRRLFPGREAGSIDLGLIRLAPGADPEAVREQIVAAIPQDVEVLTREGFIAREVAYWNDATPIGYVFAFGSAVGLLVGSIIVYQILFSDVSDHLREYATLKAMGYRDRYLFGIVLQEALLLATLGFAPGFGLAALLYRVAGEATKLPMQMEVGRSLLVLGLTVAMCCAAGSAALRKVRSADPAEVF